MRFQAIGIVPPVGAAGAPATAPSAAPGAHAAPPVEPQTAAAVRSDADDYLTLYTAGQFAIIYQMLSAPARQAIKEQAWVAVHRGCPIRSITSRSPARPRW